MECSARPMKGRHESPDNRPSNQEVSGEKKKPLPSQEEGCGGQDECVLQDRGDSGLRFWSRLAVGGRGSSGLRSFEVAHRGGGDRIVWWCSSSQARGPWTSGRGFESHRGGSGRCDRTKQDRYLGPALPTKDPRVQFLLCVCACPWAPSLSRIVQCFCSLYIAS